MTLKEIRFAFTACAALLFLPTIADAQFQGDVFFAQPSVAVPAGGTAVLEVLLFSGAEPVGAAHWDVLFDPAQAEVVKIEPGESIQLAPGLASTLSPGRAAVVNLNGSSLEEPFGTVSLARVHVRPLVAAGSRVSLNIQVHSLLLQDSTPFPEANGFSGEILVVTAAAAIVPSHAALQPELIQRAWTFRRPGAALDLLDFETRGGKIHAVRHRAVVPDPAAPSEMPVP